MGKGTKMKITEKDIQTQILQWLRYQPNVFCWRQNAGMAINEHKGRKHVWRSSDAEGISDIIGVWGSLAFAIEVKKKPNKPTPKQEMFIENFCRAGGLAFVAYSLEDVQEVWRNYQP